MSQPVLIVEDEVKLANLLRDYLLADGYEVEWLTRGDEVLPWLEKNNTRLILLDLMLPGTDGLTVCRDIRKDSNIPIIMLTARVEEIDRLLGLELGADDYVCKPYSPREVCARVKTVLKRVETESPEEGTDKIQLDDNKMEVRAGGVAVALSAVEFRMLAAMSRRPGWVFSRDKLMSTMYTDKRIISERTIDSHIKKLRKKLDDLPLEENPIRSIYGVGYKFV